MPFMPLQLAFSSNAYLDVPVGEAVARIGAAGYRGIELLADVPHAWPAGLLEVQRESIRAAVRGHGLTISNINAFMMNAIADPRQPYWHPGWTDPDPHYRAIRREHTKRALRLAAELGAPAISTWRPRPASRSSSSRSRGCSSRSSASISSSRSG
jgi:sugar phosphate isomerase/epimerase